MPVYLVRQGLLGNVKIGVTENIVSRIRGLQTGQPYRLRLMRLLEGDASDERALHRRFREFAIGGEWFQFHPEMMGDLGLKDLEHPKIGRYGKHNWPKDAIQFQRRLHEEALEAIGGADVIARRCGAPPWLITEYGYVCSQWFGALALLLAERGIQGITHTILVDARATAHEEIEEHNAKIKRRENVDSEAAWIKRHPGITPWWEVFPENKKLLSSTELEIVPSNSNAEAS